MDVKNEAVVGGSLQISTAVIAKIAQMAAMEIEGVHAVSSGMLGVRGMMHKVAVVKPVAVEITDEVAQITVNLIVEYGCKIPPLCAKVQENVKNAVQNMTGITVSRVNVVVAGVAREDTKEQAE